MMNRRCGWYRERLLARAIEKPEISKELTYEKFSRVRVRENGDMINRRIIYLVIG